MQSGLAALPNKLWRGMVDVLTPSQCLLCRAPSTAPASLCVTCWGKLAHLDDPVCDVLGTPFAYDQGPGAVSAAAIALAPPWSRARAAVAFDDVSKRLVHALKYQDRQEAGLLMARMMRRAGRELIGAADAIVPVPLHRWRLWSRRFNQSAYLAQAVAAASGKPFRPDILERRRATRQQVGLDQAGRRKNVQGAFAVTAQGAGWIAGQRLLLIDDVRTTGATAEACAAVLLAAGAMQADLLTFALVLEPAHVHI